MPHFSKFIFRVAVAAVVGMTVLPGTSSAQWTELPCINKRFSMVMHIVRDSLGEPNITETDIQGQVDYINTLWDTICVSFEICEFRYIDNFQWDTLEEVSGYRWEEMITAHEQDYRINVFYPQYIEPGEAAGFAPLGGITAPGGSICVTKGGGGGVLAHEMGHFWGLPHTFENLGTELVDGSNCSTAGDAICDTPADPYFGAPEDQYHSNCIFTATMTDPNGQYYSPDMGNIMSYYTSCSCRFTHGQYLRMANTYLGGGSPGQYMW